ncbi:MAG: PF20097 family protein, partial [bacterium]
MSSEKFDMLKCPCCGTEMEAGYIVGHWIRLRWSPVQKTQTIFAG